MNHIHGEKVSHIFTLKGGYIFRGKKSKSLKKPHSFTWGKVSQNLYIHPTTIQCHVNVTLM